MSYVTDQLAWQERVRMEHGSQNVFAYSYMPSSFFKNALLQEQMVNNFCQQNPQYTAQLRPRPLLSSRGSEYQQQFQHPNLIEMGGTPRTMCDINKTKQVFGLVQKGRNNHSRQKTRQSTPSSHKPHLVSGHISPRMCFGSALPPGTRGSHCFNPEQENGFSTVKTAMIPQEHHNYHQEQNDPVASKLSEMLHPRGASKTMRPFSANVYGGKRKLRIVSAKNERNSAVNLYQTGQSSANLVGGLLQSSQNLTQPINKSLLNHKETSVKKKVYQKQTTTNKETGIPFDRFNEDLSFTVVDTASTTSKALSKKLLKLHNLDQFNALDLGIDKVSNKDKLSSAVNLCHALANKQQETIKSLHSKRKLSTYNLRQQKGKNENPQNIKSITKMKEMLMEKIKDINDEKALAKLTETIIFSQTESKPEVFESPEKNQSFLDDPLTPRSPPVSSKPIYEDALMAINEAEENDVMPSPAKLTQEALEALPKKDQLGVFLDVGQTGDALSNLSNIKSLHSRRSRAVFSYLSSQHNNNQQEQLSSQQKINNSSNRHDHHQSTPAMNVAPQDETNTTAKDATKENIERQLKEERSARHFLELEVDDLRRRSSMLMTQIQLAKIQTPAQMNRARLLAGDILQLVRKQDGFGY